jgi:hypothetical protein
MNIKFNGQVNQRELSKPQLNINNHIHQLKIRQQTTLVLTNVDNQTIEIAHQVLLASSDRQALNTIIETSQTESLTMLGNIDYLCLLMLVFNQTYIHIYRET